MELILASSSPRRRELLERAGYIFRIVDPGPVERQTCVSGLSAVQQARALALAKGQAVVQREECGLVLGADTVVAVGHEVIGKPRDAAHAREILGLLSASKHQVITGLALREGLKGRCLVDHEVTWLRMGRLSPEQIERYIRSGLWWGKAGAYALQEDDTLVTRIQGSYSNVVGLPMELLERMLRSFVSAETLEEIKR